MKRPNTCTNLIRAIKSVASDMDEVRLARSLANIIVGQMLPDGVVKGGSSLMLRYGIEFTRYTRDVDAARVMELDDYIQTLKQSLLHGWNGFTADIAAVTPPSPEDIPQAYIMQPYDVKLKYLGRPWQTVRIEIGHNEIGDADQYEEFLPDDLAAIFEKLQFPRPNPLRLMKLSHQIAQKLHAVSEFGSARAHDLIDLQLIASHSTLDFNEIHAVCIRLFNYRKAQPWPPRIVKGVNWDVFYRAACETIANPAAILPTVDEAIVWANRLIDSIGEKN